MKKLPILMILGMVSVIFFGCQKNVTNSVRLVSFQGDDLILTRAGTALQPEVKMDLLPADRIETGPVSEAVIQIGTEGLVRISPDSCLALSDVFKKSDVSRTKLQLTKGRVFCLVTKLVKKSTFEVMAPTAVVGVRGTSFMVRVDSDAGTRVAVFAGKVRIADLVDAAKTNSVADLEEAVLPANDYSRIRITRMPQESFRQISQFENMLPVENPVMVEQKTEELQNAKDLWEKSSQEPSSAAKKQETLRW